MENLLPNRDTLLVRSPNLVAAELDGDLVMMNAEAGQYYGISGVGARAFELLECPMSIDGLVEFITQEFDIDENTCRQDMQKFVKTLIEKGLVQKTNT